MAEKGGSVSAGTKDRILDVAERLFGERGYAATSLRAVTDAAGVNVAAVNYHFGSKEGLLRAVVDRAMRPVNEERRRLLEEFLANGGRPDVADLVEAFVRTGANLARRRDGDGSAVSRFLGRVMSEPDPGIRQLFADEVETVEGRYLEELNRALPGVPAPDVAFRYRVMVGLLALHQAGALADLAPYGVSGETAPTDADAETDRLVAAVLAVFRAP
ncbi:TetR/AcrR family transcriptional regulator [Streptomyces sp. 5-6(2022)]|uniref:TetR/AcrR family transcriptional regulator n=1 Tax=Streptomyces sp. 5-6(2022) TaxID=2936510 RepID=UPI001CC321B3|nr:TetR/AcrR family transcriptional regulator [Streptomyces sp. 5-6(2022)]